MCMCVSNGLLPKMHTKCILTESLHLPSDLVPMKQKNDFKTSFEVLINPFAHVEKRQNVTPVRLLSKPVIL